jgi:hypothetical protein
MSRFEIARLARVALAHSPRYGSRDLAEHLSAFASSGRNVFAEARPSWSGVPLRTLDVQPL